MRNRLEIFSPREINVAMRFLVGTRIQISHSKPSETKKYTDSPVSVSSSEVSIWVVDSSEMSVIFEESSEMSVIFEVSYEMSIRLEESSEMSMKLEESSEMSISSGELFTKFLRLEELSEMFATLKPFDVEVRAEGSKMTAGPFLLRAFLISRKWSFTFDTS